MPFPLSIFSMYSDCTVFHSSSWHTGIGFILCSTAVIPYSIFIKLLYSVKKSTTLNAYRKKTALDLILSALCFLLLYIKQLSLNIGWDVFWAMPLVIQLLYSFIHFKSSNSKLNRRSFISYIGSAVLLMESIICLSLFYEQITNKSSSIYTQDPIDHSYIKSAISNYEEKKTFLLTYI